MTVRAHRKVVTVLFCDVVGSTALGESVDPEALQRVKRRRYVEFPPVTALLAALARELFGW